MQTLDRDSAGLAAAHEELVEIDRSLRLILRGQPEPPKDEKAWAIHGTRLRRHNERRRLKAQIPVIRDLIRRRQDLWAVYNDRARPYLSHKGLPDLPREVLGIILSQYDTNGPDRDYTEPVPNRGRDIVQDIQSIQLSCRQLNEEASRLLVPHVSIEMTTDSMEHLEKVIAHPFIGPGVKCLRLILPHYPSEMADSRVVFKQVQIRRQIRLWERTYQPEYYVEHLQVKLDRAYAAYKELHKQQEEMKQSLGESLAQLIRRMSGITQLEIYDEPVTGGLKILGWNASQSPTSGRKLDTSLDFYKDVIDNLTERFTVPFLKWEDHDYLKGDHVLTMEDVGFVRKLLVYLGTAGIKLTRLSIKPSAPKDLSDFKCDDDEKTALQALAENLQHFHFSTGIQKENKLRSGKELTAVSSFMSPLSRMPNLQVLAVDFEGMMKARARCTHYTPVLSQTPQRPLKKLALRYVNIKGPAFGTFLANLNSSLDLVIYKCKMVDGTWRELMDTMKELADPARPSGKRLRLLEFTFPSGAEVDSLGSKHFGHIFGWGGGSGRLTGNGEERLSLARAYVLHKCNVVENPLSTPSIVQNLNSN
ncbi:putative benzoate 4-monooxygenase cytochrome p450 protein [Colletotrichum asianum]